MRTISDTTRYWRVLIGKRTALLAQNAEFSLTYADETSRRNASVFSNCRKYASDRTVIFAPSVPPEHPPATMERSLVPPGTQLQVVLDRTLDANEASVGDPIRAHLAQGAGGLPKGASVYGRVNRIINFDDQIPLPRPARHSGDVLIQIEFLQIEYRRTRVPFIARLIDLESQPGKRNTNIRGFGYLENDALVRYDPPGTASV